MTDYAVALGNHTPEYGYGLGYGYSFGTWSAHYSARLLGIAPDDTLAEANSQMWPAVEYPSDPGSGNIDLGLDTVRNPADEGTVGHAFGGFSAAPLLSSTAYDGYLAIGGSVQRFFLYDKIYIIPSVVDLGVVTVDTTSTTNVWNAFLTDRTITAIEAIGSGGMTDSLTPDLPVTLYALDESEWVFDISATIGNPVINASFRFLSDGVYYGVSFTGIRSETFAFVHNWIDPLTETLEWKTSLRITYDGTEARAALRDVARRSSKTTLYLDSADLKNLENLSFKWQARPVLVPFQQYQAALTSAALAGESTLYVANPTMNGFIAGGNAILHNFRTKVKESLIILEVPGTEDRITLTSPITGDWGANSVIFPAASALVRGNIPVIWQTQNFATGSAVFDFTPALANPLTPVETVASLPSTSKYRDEEVLVIEPNWEGGLSKDFQFSGGLVENLTGVLTTFETHTRPSRTTTYNWLFKTQAEMYAFRKFLYRRAGMAVSFWMSSWVNDFNSLALTYSAGDQYFRFTDNGFYRNSANKVERQHLQIQLKNGTILRRKITSCSELTPGLVSEVALDSTYGVQFTSTDIVRASFLSRYRLASDSVDITWLHPRAATISLGLTTVPDYPVQDEA